MRDSIRGVARRVAVASLVVGVWCGIGCGGTDDDANLGSGGSMAAPAEPRRSAENDGEAGGNRAPEIRSVRLEPSEPVAGMPIRAIVSAFDPDGDPVELGYVWELNGRSVRASGAQATFGELASGDRISVRVVASDGRGQSEPFVTESTAGNRPPRIDDVVIHTRTEDDGTSVWLVEPVAEDPDGDRITFDVEWRAGHRVVGRGETLGRSGWKRGDEIVVVVTARDRENASASLESAPIVIGNSAPDIVSKPPGLDASGTFEYQIEATDPDGDRGLRYSLGEAPDGMEVDPFGGLVTWKASIDDAGEHKVEVVVDDRNGSTTKQVFFLTVKAKNGSSPASIR